MPRRYPRAPGRRTGFPHSLTGLAVDRLPDQVGVTVVACVLLDHVHQDPTERERRVLMTALPCGLLLEAAADQGGVNHPVGTAYRLVEERQQLFGGVVPSGVPFPVAVGVPVDVVER